MSSRSITRRAVIEIEAVPTAFDGGVYVPVHEFVPVTRVRVPIVPADVVMYELNIALRSSLDAIVSVVVWPVVNVPDPERVIESVGTGVVESIVMYPV